MKAAVVSEAGQSPLYGDFETPAPALGECRVTVSAAALSHLVRSRVSRAHYSSAGTYPFIAGVDGVGRLDDGRRVYFFLPHAPFGSMAEVAVVPAAQCLPLPDGLDDITAAAIANPGMSSFAALTERVRLKPGQTVLVNGATGTAGRLAVQVARYLGAGKILATGRNREALAEVAALGADETIALAGDGRALAERFEAQFAEGVDVVIDYLWGESAECLLRAAAKAGAETVPVQFLQVGAASGPDITLPGAALRASAITLMGSGIGSIPLDRLARATSALLHATLPGGFRIETTPVPLSDVAAAWTKDDSAGRTVFTPGPPST